MTGFFLGVACGLLFSSLTVMLGAFCVLFLGSGRRGLLQLLPSGVALPLVFLAISAVIPLVGALVGGLLGLVYGTAVVVYPGAGLASPNLAFTLAVLILVLIPLLTWVAGRRRPHWVAAVLSLAFALIFGWLLPWLVSA